MRILPILGLFLIQGCVESDSVKTVEAFKIPPPIGLVSDYEQVFTSEEISMLKTAIQEVNSRGRIHLGVASFDNSYVSDSLFSDYA